MPEDPQFDVGKYLDLASRRRWWIIMPFCVAVVVGLTAVKVLPKSYKVSTLILLEPRAIPDSFVKSTITESVDSRIYTIQQQIQSRTNLEAIIDAYKIDHDRIGSPMMKIRELLAGKLPLFGAGEKAATDTREDVLLKRARMVEELQRCIAVTLGKQTGGSAQKNLAFEISFEWPDPEIMAPVVNTVVARFIEDNMSAREEQAIGTTDFFEKETTALRGDIEARERELEAFKKEHMGMLPDQLQSNLAVLNQLRDQAQGLQRSLDQDSQQVMLLKSQATIAQMERGGGAQATGSTGQRRISGTRRDSAASTEELTSGSLMDLEDELARLSAHYTAEHPDVVALKRRIEEMRREGPRADRTSPAPSGRSAAALATEMQVMQINARIESTKKEMKEVERQMQVYKDRVERTPQVEMALNKILRDYTTARQRYDDLQSKKMDAKMSEQLEKRRKGEQFRVLDPAVKPLKPFKPVPLKIMMMALVAGLGLGAACAYLREMLDPGFYNPGDLEAFAGVNVLVSLPNLSVKAKS